VPSRNLLLVSLILAFTLFSQVPHSSGIYNGSSALGNDFLVRFINENSDCSGSIVAPRIIATAAHCVVRYGVAVAPESIKVFPPGADLNVSPNSSFQDSGPNLPPGSGNRRVDPVARGMYLVYPPKYYNNSSSIEANDIAFIVLDKEIQIKNKLKFPETSVSDEELILSPKIYAYGYGALISGGSSSNLPSKAPVQTRPKFGIQGLVGYENSYFMFTNNSSGGVCRGDSGGPVVVEFFGSNYLVGVMSGGTGPCVAGSDQKYWGIVATRFSSYKNLFQEAESKSLVLQQIADRTEIELKAKQEAEARAAAELKAKQEAEAAQAAAELKAKQEAEAKAAAAKKTTITCAKGKLTKKVTAVKPKCPTGYKVKK
jgi:hypothetical protein